MTIKTRNRTSSTVPFGYVLHPENDHLIIENDQDQKVLQEIREKGRTLSLREASRYVEANTGRKLTPRGIKKILDRSY